MPNHDTFAAYYGEDVKESAGTYDAAAAKTGYSRRQSYRYKDGEVEEDKQAAFVARNYEQGVITRRTVKCHCSTRCAVGRIRQRENFKYTKKTASHSGLKREM